MLGNDRRCPKITSFSKADFKSINYNPETGVFSEKRLFSDIGGHARHPDTTQAQDQSYLYTSEKEFGALFC